MPKSLLLKPVDEVPNTLASGPNHRSVRYPAAQSDSSNGLEIVSWTTSRLNPSALFTLLNLYGGKLALPVPGFHSADVSTYPLIVVEERAVITGLAFSSALAADDKLTTPRAARATVHLLNFISSSDVYACYVCCVTS